MQTLKDWTPVIAAIVAVAISIMLDLPVRATVMLATVAALGLFVHAGLRERAMDDEPWVLHDEAWVEDPLVPFILRRMQVSALHSAGKLTDAEFIDLVAFTDEEIDVACMEPALW